METNNPKAAPNLDEAKLALNHAFVTTELLMNLFGAFDTPTKAQSEAVMVATGMEYDTVISSFYAIQAHMNRARELIDPSI